MNPELKNIKEMLSQHFPNLSQNTYGSVLEATKEDVLNSIGDLPTEDDYIEQMGDVPHENDYIRKIRVRDLVKPLDIFAPIIFIFIVVVSLIHMLELGGYLADLTFKAQPDTFQGITIFEKAYVIAHQLALFFFSEIGVIYFYTEARSKTTMLNRNTLYTLLFAFLILYANISALTRNSVTTIDLAVGLAVGTLVTLTTLGLGERMSEIAGQWLKQREAQREAFKVATINWQAELVDIRRQVKIEREVWFAYKNNPESHPDFNKFLARQIVAYYHRTKVGKEFTEWSPIVEKMLAAREMARIRELDGGVDALMQGFFTPSASLNEPIQIIQTYKDPEMLGQGLSQDQLYQIKKMIDSKGMGGTSLMANPEPKVVNFSPKKN